MKLLAPGLLDGRAIALAGRLPETLAQSLEELGARLAPLERLDAAAEAVGDWARAQKPLNGLVYDGGQTFAGGGPEALLGMMQEAWTAVRGVAAGALIGGAGPGKLVLLGPRPEAGPGAPAASAALENLARTLSVEWARHDVTAVMVAPGTGVNDAELADLICFLCSPAGDYLSGCRIELGR
jgi:NAD(P)-dependent dehydrogenase (short-subunit alcohol dehydrogenase family)